MKYLYDYLSELALTATVALGTFVLILIRKAFTNEKVIEAVKKDNKQALELIEAKLAHSDELIQAKLAHSDEKVILVHEEIKEVRKYILDQNNP